MGHDGFVTKETCAPFTAKPTIDCLLKGTSSMDSIEMTYTPLRGDYKEILGSKFAPWWQTAFGVLFMLAGMALTVFVKDMKLVGGIWIGLSIQMFTLYPTLAKQKIDAVWKPELGDTRHYTLSVHGIDSKCNHGTSSSTWNAFTSWGETTRVIVVNRYDSRLYFLSKEGHDSESLARIRALLAEKISVPKRGFPGTFFSVA